jgi:hypothetical protein
MRGAFFRFLGKLVSNVFSQAAGEARESYSAAGSFDAGTISPRLPGCVTLLAYQSAAMQICTRVPGRPVTSEKQLGIWCILRPHSLSDGSQSVQRGNNRGFSRRVLLADHTASTTGSSFVPHNPSSITSHYFEVTSKTISMVQQRLAGLRDAILARLRFDPSLRRSDQLATGRKLRADDRRHVFRVLDETAPSF